jgi:hypothetical protein
MGSQKQLALYEISKLFKSEKGALRVLAAALHEPLSAERIVEKSGLSPIQCHRIIRKLREFGLMKLVKSAVSEGISESGSFLYQTQLDDEFITFKNGRFVARFPAILNLPDGRKIHVKTFFEA